MVTFRSCSAVTLVLAALSALTLLGCGVKISGVEPECGNAGETATVYGEGLARYTSDRAVLTVGGIEAEVTSASYEVLTFIVPDGVQPGPLDIVATTPDGTDKRVGWEICETRDLTVARVELTPAALTLTETGETYQLTAQAYNAADEPIPADFTWSSSAPDQVSVDAAGLVQAVVSIGSSVVTASASSIDSNPSIVAVATPVPNATFVDDAQVIDGPEFDDPNEEVLGLGTRLRVTLELSAAPFVGDILLARGESLVNGRVVDVEVTGNQLFLVTFEVLALEDLYTEYAIDVSVPIDEDDWVFPEDFLAAYDIVEEADGSFTATLKSEQEKAKFSAFGFLCDGNSGVPLNAVAPSFNFQPPAGRWQVQLFDSSQTRSVAFISSQPLKLSFSIEVKLSAAFSGKLTCKRIVVEAPNPLQVPLIGGVNPGAGAMFEVDVETTIGGVGFKADVAGSLDYDLGFQCPPNQNCDVLLPSGNFDGTELTPIFPDLVSNPLGQARIELKALFAGAVADLSVGASRLNPAGAASIDLIEALLGASLEGSIATPKAQVEDTSYKSNYSFGFLGKARTSSETNRILGVVNFTLLQIDLVFLKSNPPLFVSPEPLGALANRATFDVGDLVDFEVTLDPALTDFFGLYNVDSVAVFYRDPATGNLVEKARQQALPGESTVVVPWTADFKGGIAGNFFSFVSTNLLLGVDDLELTEVTPGQDPTPVEDCSNGVDDDGDGLVDCIDPDPDCSCSCPGEIKLVSSSCATSAGAAQGSYCALQNEVMFLPDIYCSETLNEFAGEFSATSMYSDTETCPNGCNEGAASVAGTASATAKVLTGLSGLVISGSTTSLASASGVFSRDRIPDYGSEVFSDATCSTIYRSRAPAKIRETITVTEDGVPLPPFAVEATAAPETDIVVDTFADAKVRVEFRRREFVGQDQVERERLANLIESGESRKTVSKSYTIRAVEACDNGLDDNCDGLTDCDDPDCACECAGYALVDSPTSDPYALECTCGFRANGDSSTAGLLVPAGQCTISACGGSFVDVRVFEPDTVNTVEVVCAQDPCDPNPCNDGDPCTDDLCSPIDGSCSYPQITCDDGDPCTTDTCDSNAGGCIATPKDCSSPPNACASSGVCVAGNCQYNAVICSSDGNECTFDTCDPSQGCTYPNKPDFTACSVGLCQQGVCDPGAGFECSEAGIRQAIAATSVYEADVRCPPGGAVIPISSEIVIDRSMILNGFGLLTLDGGGDHRVISIAPRASVELLGIRVQNGGGVETGGGIFNEGFLRLTDVVVTGNTATVAGGGIYSVGSDFIPANLAISKSTIANNDAPIGVGIYGDNTDMLISNSTIDERAPSIGADAIVVYGQLEASYTTILVDAQNGEGPSIVLDAGRPVDINVCLIEGGCNQALVPVGPELVGNVEFPTDSCGFDPAWDNRAGVSYTAAAVSPSLVTGLGPTPVVPLQPESQLIDIIPSPYCFGTDQVGTPRPASGCEPGAVEFVPAP